VFIVQQTKKESTAPSWVLLIILTTDRSWFQRIEVKRRRRRLVNLYRKVCVTQISKRNEIKKARKKNNKKKKKSVWFFFFKCWNLKHFDIHYDYVGDQSNMPQG
jgi:hypothetical protein